MADKSKKVLYISPLPPPAGGISTWTKTILENNICEGYVPMVVNTSVINNRAIFTSVTINKDEIYRAIKIFVNLIKVLKNNKISIVHLNCSTARLGMVRDLVCVLIIKTSKVPILIQFHANVPSILNKNYFKLSNILLKLLVRLSTTVLVLNKPSMNEIKKIQTRTTYEKYRLIPNFIEDDLLNKYKLKAHENINKKVLYAGSVTKQKGIVELFQVARRLLDIEFHLFGKVSPDIEEILQEKPKNIFLKGEIEKEELLQELESCDIFVFPSHTEGFPIAVLEAMSVGVPIIATKVGAIPEMLRYCSEDVLIDIGNTDQLFEKIVALLENTKKALMIGENNKKTVIENYKYSKVIREISKAYNDTIGIHSS